MVLGKLVYVSSINYSWVGGRYGYGHTMDRGITEC